MADEVCLTTSTWDDPRMTWDSSTRRWDVGQVCVEPLELGLRLGIADPTPETLARLARTLQISVHMLNPHVDAELCEANPLVFAEAVYQLSVRLWDLSTKGNAEISLMGDMVMPAPAATAGLIRSVWAFVLALSPTGGMTV